MDSDKMKDWLLAVVTPLVTKSEVVNVVKTNDERGVLYTLKVADEDAGKVIGRKGETINAIRLLLRQVGFNTQVQASLKLDVPEKRTYEGGKY